jgi:selenocysteine-specific elongation factor
MRSLLVGVVGHVDHGKTALVRALTGKDTDRLPEEKARGVSILPGFALLRTPAGEIDLVDLPGHERFIRAMISGATGMSAVLLAVAANEGVKPQTLEHLAIARLIGVRRGVVALTKADLVPAEVLAARAADIGDLLGRFALAAPVVATSAVDGRGVAAVAEGLDALLREGSPPRDDGFAYLPIDRVFVVPGIGPVVTGTLRRGALRVGDPVELCPGGRTARIRGLQIHDRPVEVAAPGRRVAAALRGVEQAELARGLALATPGALVASRWLDAIMACAKGAPRPIESGERVRLLVGTTEVEARVRLAGPSALRPGDSGVGQIHCASAVAVPAREPFVLRLASPALTLGGGRILDPAARRRRRDAPAQAALGALADSRPAAILMARLAEAGPAGCAAADLARLLGVAPDRVRRRLAEIGAKPPDGDRVVHPDAWAGLHERLLAGLAAHHRERPLEHGWPHDRAATLVGGCADPGVLHALVAELAAQGAVVADRGLLRRADFHPAEQGSALTRTVEEAFRNGRLQPPDEAVVVAEDPGRRDALRFLQREGLIVRARDRVQNRTILFHREAVDEAAAALRRRFGDAPFLAREAGAVWGTTRKFSIPLLEHLDAAGVTIRRGDARVLAPGPKCHGGA